MTPKDFKDQVAQKSAHDNELAIRCLIEYPVRGWRLFPLRKAMSADFNDLHLPEHAHQTIRVASVYVTVKHGKVIALRRLEISEWSLDADGRIDQEKLMAGIIKKFDQGTGGQHDDQGHASDTISDVDILEIRQSLGLPPPSNLLV